MMRWAFLDLQATAFALLMGFAVIAQAEVPIIESKMTKKTQIVPQVMIETSQGNFVVELYPDKAPNTVRNFLRYVNEGFYDDTIFHRVIPSFMIQGGGYNRDMSEKSVHAPIKNEANNGLRNRIGTIAMARTNDPHSATAQFFINVSQNSNLDFREKNGSSWGYAVFGKVIKGMEAINQIRTVKTDYSGGHEDVPVTTVRIVKARQIK